MTQTNDTESKKSIWRRYFLFGFPLVGFVGAFVAGIIFWGGFNTADRIDRHVVNPFF